MVTRADAVRAGLVVLTLSVVVTLGLAASNSTAAFSVYNSDWDGARQLRSTASGTGTQVVVAHETTGYERVRPGDTVALVMSPDSTYGATASTRVSEFVRAGGTLVVAGDYGTAANKLLRTLGASARLDGRPLRDVRSNYRSPAMPVATRIENRSVVSGVESLTLNYGTVVRPNGATPLVNTSSYAYLDADRNGRIGQNETLSSYPVVTVERIGRGRVVVVSDSSAFINAMLDRPGNRQFVKQVLASRGTLLIDSSHSAGLPPLQSAVLFVQDSPFLQFAIGVAAIGVLGLWSRRWSPSIFQSAARDDDLTANPRFGREELRGYLERRHPDWDHRHVERVVSALRRRRDN